MNNSPELPQNYREIYRIDLNRDKKTALIIQLLALLIAFPVGLIGMFFAPLSSLYELSGGIGIYIAKFVVLLVGLVIYIILHEAVHGICMKHFGAKKIDYGFKGLYAYAGSQFYFNKKSYIIIALAPIVFWGIVLLLVNFIVPRSWFWVVYLIQICNLSGAAGDLYVTKKFSSMPRDILTLDTGVAMTVYAPVV